jgi:hypothetical protein
MQAMLIPPLPFEAPDGIRIYPEEPAVQDQKTDRGDFVFGRRIQSAKYLIQKEGDYALPAIELKWWNLTTIGWLWQRSLRFTSLRRRIQGMLRSFRRNRSRLLLRSRST